MPMLACLPGVCQLFGYNGVFQAMAAFAKAVQGYKTLKP